jgi:hypothetical protein
MRHVGRKRRRMSCAESTLEWGTVGVAEDGEGYD